MQAIYVIANRDSAKASSRPVNDIDILVICSMFMLIKHQNISKQY